MVLGAHVELASKPDDTLFRRSMPLPEFFVGPGKTRLAPAELLTAVRIPIPPKGFVARFHKFGTRPALDISAISIGVGGVLKDGKFSQVRVAFGAVAPTPVCGCATEKPWKAGSSTPPPSPPPPRRRRTKCIPSPTCAPAPGTARR
jgi:xanthine dehydrogenase FAD-binding subunit